MVSSQPIVLFLFLALVVVSGEGFFSRRRNQKNQPAYQRPMNSNFRQRLGTQRSGANYLGNAREIQQPLVGGVGSNRDLNTGTAYSASAASYEGAPSYGGGYESGGPMHSGSGGSVNPISALVAPLAALALLGAAAAVASSPVLMTVAVLSSGRKRRDLEQIGSDAITPEIESKLEEMETLEKYIARVPGREKQQEKLMATYLSCSGFTESNNACLDRVVCDYSVQPNKMNELERDVVSIVLFNIMSNAYVPQEYKERLRKAAQYGRNRGHCSAFLCDQLSSKQ